MAFVEFTATEAVNLTDALTAGAKALSGFATDSALIKTLNETVLDELKSVKYNESKDKLVRISVDFV